jgi:hypothetical protein
MDQTLISHQEFGGAGKPTIYYIVGFRMKIKHFKLPINILRLGGYRVLAFDIDPAVLTSGDPKLLGRSLDEFMAVVKADAASHTVAGTYGISLGSFFALNALTLSEVPKIFMNTGGGSILQAVWEMEVLASVKEAFEKRGFGRDTVGREWNPIDVSQHIDRIAGKQMIANASYADEYIPIKTVLEHVEDWQKQGVKARFIVYKHLKHKWLIIRTLFKFRTTVKYFR